jgi:hypothetical protein
MAAEKFKHTTVTAVVIANMVGTGASRLCAGR